MKLGGQYHWNLHMSERSLRTREKKFPTRFGWETISWTTLFLMTNKRRTSQSMRFESFSISLQLSAMNSFVPKTVRSNFPYLMKNLKQKITFSPPSKSGTVKFLRVVPQSRLWMPRSCSPNLRWDGTNRLIQKGKKSKHLADLFLRQPMTKEVLPHF